MSISVRRFISSALLVFLFVGVVRALPVKAEPAEWTFLVDSFEDINDTALNTSCHVGNPDPNIGPCTLRAAIAEANAICDTFDITIYIPEGFYRLQIPPDTDDDIRSGDLNFPTANPDLKIKLIGTGSKPSIIDANQLDRVFRIHSDVNLEMENIHIRSGMLSLTSDVLGGAGILNHGNLLLKRVTIEENIARCGLPSCTFTADGGGILNYGRVYMQDSTIFDNVADWGSAIFTAGPTGYFFMKNSTIYGNYASGSATITNHAFLHIRNSTITANTAPVGYETGIRNWDTLIVESSTIANSGPNSSIINHSGAKVTIHDSILKNMSGGGDNNCRSDSGSIWESLGYNLYSDDSCPTSGVGDLSNADPKLWVLGNYGGPTKTIPLIAGSPSQNHRPGVCTNISEFAAVPPYTLTEDQRHAERTDNACDTGAYEGVITLRSIFLPLIRK